MSLNQILNIIDVNDETKIKENATIAKQHVTNFCTYLKETKGFNIEIEKQGSAVEGIRVDNTNVFDFLLILADVPYKESPDYRIQRQYDKLKRSNPVFGNYTPIQLDEHRQNKLFDDFQERMPRETEILSARKTALCFQTYIDDYINHLIRHDMIDGFRKGLRRYAPGTKLCKYGSEVSVDMTICVKYKGITYIPSPTRKHIIYEGLKKRGATIDMLWRKTCSLKERNTILQQRTENQRKNYRISKSILRNQVPNSYILKTIFLRKENDQEVGSGEDGSDVFEEDSDQENAEEGGSDQKNAEEEDSDPENAEEEGSDQEKAEEEGSDQGNSEEEESSQEETDNNDSDSMKPYAFLTYMVESLQTGYSAELGRRNGNAATEDLLIARYNDEENVLAQFPKKDIEKRLLRLKELNRLRLSDSKAFLGRLIGKKELEFLESECLVCDVFQ